MDLADPYRDPGQLSGIGVELDAEHVLGPDHGEGPGQTQGLGLQDDLMLQVLEGAQGQVQEIARAAGGVQYPEMGEPGEESLLHRLGLLLGLGAGTRRAAGSGLGHQGGDLGLVSSSGVEQGLQDHGWIRRRMEPGSV